MRNHSENYLMDNLFLCIRRTEHHDPKLNRKQIPGKLDPQKELITSKELLLPGKSKRRHSLICSPIYAVSMIKDRLLEKMNRLSYQHHPAEIIYNDSHRINL